MLLLSLPNTLILWWFVLIGFICMLIHMIFLVNYSVSIENSIRLSKLFWTMTWFHYLIVIFFITLWKRLPFWIQVTWKFLAPLERLVVLFRINLLSLIHPWLIPEIFGWILVPWLFKFRWRELDLIPLLLIIIVNLVCPVGLLEHCLKWYFLFNYCLIYLHDFE